MGPNQAIHPQTPPRGSQQLNGLCLALGSRGCLLHVCPLPTREATSTHPPPVPLPLWATVGVSRSPCLGAGLPSRRPQGSGTSPRPAPAPLPLQLEVQASVGPEARAGKLGLRADLFLSDTQNRPNPLLPKCRGTFGTSFND